MSYQNLAFSNLTLFRNADENSFVAGRIEQNSVLECLMLIRNLQNAKGVLNIPSYF